MGPGDKVLLFITPGDPLAEILLPVPITLYSCKPRVLRINNDPAELEVKTSS